MNRIKIHKHTPPYTWHYFRLKDQPIFAFAGLYDIWKDKTSDKDIYSYTIITTTPNSIVGTIHNRMPVILHKEDERGWLDPDTVEPERLLPLLKPYPAKQIETWRVGDEARHLETITRIYSNQANFLIFRNVYFIPDESTTRFHTNLPHSEPKD